MTSVAPMAEPGYQPQPAYPAPVQPGYAPPPQPGYPPQPGVQVQQPGYPPGGYAQPPPGPQYGQQQPITAQPQGPSGGGDLWMPPPPNAPPPGCPPGLEYMTLIDQLIVKQKVEMMEMVTGFETNNKYKIKNSMGQTVFKAKEDTDCCMRNCCGPSREFHMKIYDNAENEVIHLHRFLRCGCCCTPCDMHEIEVQAPPGTPIGYVVQTWSFCTPLFSPQFDILDENKNPVLRIEGPGCMVECCSDMEFKVMSLDGLTQVGKVTKQWSGFMKEAFTDADNFGINFPMDLDVKAKATMLGAVFLIDFMFFEKSENSNNGAYSG